MAALRQASRSSSRLPIFRFAALILSPLGAVTPEVGRWLACGGALSWGSERIRSKTESKNWLPSPGTRVDSERELLDLPALSAPAVPTCDLPDRSMPVIFQLRYCRECTTYL